MSAALQPVDLTQYGLETAEVIHNASRAKLYEDAVAFSNAAITESGALAVRSGEKTGRSPRDKRIVDDPASTADIWWGDINLPLSQKSFRINRRRALDYLNTRQRLYVQDGFAGWDSQYRLKIRVVCESPYHALFMRNMLIRPTGAELQEFGTPDYLILNAGSFPANAYTDYMTSSTSVDLSFEERQLVILGTQYAGEMKKGVFTIMHYLMPKRGVLSMHCSANEGSDGDTSLFFGLSGTGKTTLSADVRRRLIGDDEHCWTDDGIFNIEGGCYAKAIDLSVEKEPQIHQAIRFGTVLENVVFDATTREVDFRDGRITENTRAAYPIEYIPNAKIPCVGRHPRNIVFLTCDAFGVLPPVSKLTPAQAMYHFISGYTAKVAGTEMGVTEPQATFSAGFGAAFLVLHPARYAELLAEKLRRHHTQTWLVNTGWTGGGYGSGQRISLAHTRAIIDAIHDGSLAGSPVTEDPIFRLAVPARCTGVPDRMLLPRDTWSVPADYDAAARKLVSLFEENFARFADHASQEVRSAGPAEMEHRAVAGPGAP